MKTSRLWLIAGAAALVAVLLGVTAAILRSGEGDAPLPTTAASEAPAPAPTAPTPAPITTPTPTIEPEQGPQTTCDNTATADFLAMMRTRGWAATDTPGAEAAPFSLFPDGPRPGAILCRWQADTGVPSDTFIDLAWAPLPEEAQADVIQTFGARGYTLTQEAEGVFVELPGTDVYLITSDDVRWAQSRANLAYISAPPAG